MCGIAGFTTYSAPGFDSDGVIRAMTREIRHRGPDGEGYFQDPGAMLGHRRLAIIDPDGGAQPMSDMEGRYTLVYNGEVYNYPELRREMEGRGRRFATQSDAEVLLQCLAAEGTGALAKLEGMFAFALWDRRERRLLLARDRAGIKPLFYFCSGADIVFASELKALSRHPAMVRALDPLSVSKYFSYGYVPAPHTIFSGVRKLEAGEWLSFDAGGAKQGRYWDIPLADNPVSTGNIDECCEQLLFLMGDAVRRQLRSDVPVGLFLSGGIDSSAITALAAKESPARLRSFSIGFDEPSHDESAHAGRVAALFGTEHETEVLTMGGTAAIFPQVMQSFDEPLADASAVPTWALCRMAARHVKTTLGGDGGDELFAGYPAFQAHKAVQWLSFPPAMLRDALGRLARRTPVSHRYTSAGHLMQQFVKGLGMSPEARFLLWMGVCGNAEKQRLFSTAFRERVAGGDPFEDIQRYVRRSGLTDSLQRLQYLCMKMYFQDGILVKVDRASMAHSLEVRVPFMDRALVDFACRIQPFYKLRGLTTKYALKRALRGLLPDAIIHRRKAGFMMPVAALLNRDLRPMVCDLCSPAAVAAAGIFDEAHLRRMLDDHFQSRRDSRKQIYALLCFMAWWHNHSGV